MSESQWETVRTTVADGIGWLKFHRPDKRNAMSPTLNVEMAQALHALDADDDCGVVVLTGAGDAWSAGMDLKEYFREVDNGPLWRQREVRTESQTWQFRILRYLADDRDGQRLVLRRRVHPAGLLRPGDRRRRGDVRPVGDQLGPSRPGAWSRAAWPTPSAAATRCGTS
ncbi:MAG TPA: enoyl-CoA hydratase-related protein [Baekduia sp.]|nr:enoyl-CoA hydratase-related protein [Baekduia sp.]